MAVNPFDIKAPDIDQQMIEDAGLAAFGPTTGQAGTASSATSTNENPFTYSSDTLGTANTHTADSGLTSD